VIQPKTAYSFSLNRAEEGISSLMQPILTHLVRVKMFPNNEAVNHWKQELATWLLQLSRYATNVKTPTGKVKPRTLLIWMQPFITDYYITSEEYLSSLTYGKGDPVSVLGIQAGIERIIPLILNQTPIAEILNKLLTP